MIMIPALALAGAAVFVNFGCASVTAQQFGVSTAVLSEERRNFCGAAWDNVAVFVGPTASLDVLEDGALVSSGVPLGMSSAVNCIAAAAFPGTVVFSSGSALEFFDVATRTLAPFNVSATLSGGAREAVVGSLTYPLAFFSGSGGVAVVNTTARQLVPGSEYLQYPSGGRSNIALALATGPSGREFVIVAGGQAGGTVSAAIDVVPVDSPTAFLPSGTSSLAIARSGAQCAGGGPGTFVCFGGTDASGGTADDAEVCSVSDTGLVTCAAKEPSGRIASFATVRALLPMGPHVLAFLQASQRPSHIVDGLTPPSVASFPVTDLPYDSFLFSGPAVASSSRFAYVAGGNLGISGPRLRNVTVIECLPPCQAGPLPPSSAPGTVPTSPPSHLPPGFKADSNSATTLSIRGAILLTLVVAFLD